MLSFLLPNLLGVRVPAKNLGIAISKGGFLKSGHDSFYLGHCPIDFEGKRCVNEGWSALRQLLQQHVTNT